MISANGHIPVAQLPASNEDIERSCLGLMLWRPGSIPDCAALIRSPEDFTTPARSLLYARILALHRAGGEFDPATITAGFESEPSVVREIGLCCDRVMHGVGPPTAYCASVVAEIARKRRLFDRLAIVQSTIGESDTIETIADLRRQLDDLTPPPNAAPDQTPGELMASFVAECIDGQQPHGLATGFSDIDYALGSLLPGELILVAGRTSMGKSALCLNIASNIARNGGRVAYLSVEMPPKMLMARIASSISGVPVRDFTRQRPTPLQASMLARVPSVVESWDITLLDAAGWSVAQVESAATTLARKRPLDLLVVDYIQKIQSGNHYNSRQDEVSHVSGECKNLAMRLGVPVIAAAQINRMTESSSDKRPQIHHLRESGSLEQDADAVLLLHREDYYHRREPDRTPTDIAEVDIAKNRSGEQAMVELMWHGQTMTFRDRPAPAPVAPPIRQVPLEGIPI